MGQKTFAIWDLGATKCVAAIISFDESTGSFHCLQRCYVVLSCFQSVDELLAHIEFLLDHALSRADAICIAGAGQYDGKELRLEGGYPYAMDFARLAKAHDWQNMTVVHDYVPVACATFTSYLDDPEHCLVLNKGMHDPAGRRIVMGLGTGLGVKDVVPLQNKDFWLGTNEAGHMGICCPPHAKRELLVRHQELIKFLRSEGVLGDHEPLTFEKILSGKGLVRVYRFLSGNGPLLPEEVGRAMSAGQLPETLQMMSWYLGLFIGTVQLAVMPTGGIWVTGGVILKNIAICQHSDLLEGMYASPAYRQEREKMPLSVITGPDYALLGGAYYAAQRMLA